jgi:hypothetical protein
MKTFLWGAATSACLVALAACGEGTPTTAATEATPAAVPAAPVKPKVQATIVDPTMLGYFLVVPKSGDTGVILPDSSAYEIRSKGTDRVAAGDGDGVLVRVPVDIASQLGGRTVKVEITARSSPKDGAAAAKVMYFRPGSERGSGWQDMPLTQDFSPFSFEYLVPTAVSTTGWDNIGFWADPEGKGRGIEISAITVETVD